jgi:hypothetical protein
MARHSEHISMGAAPEAGTYKQLNIFGSPTGIRISMQQGETLPPLPEGRSWVRAGDDEDEC